MIRLFQERFSGHELPAPEGAWQAISSQLTLSAAASADGVGELFRDRFAEHQVDVDPGVWDAISGQLGHGAAAGAGAGGWGAVAGWAAAGIGVLVMTAGVVLWSQERDQPVADGAKAAEAPITVPKQEAANVTDPLTTDPDKAASAADIEEPRMRPEPEDAERNTVPTGLEGDAEQRMPSEEETKKDGGDTSPRITPSSDEVPLPLRVIQELASEATHEVPQPSDTMDPILEAGGDMLAPPEFGHEEEAQQPFHLFLPNVFTPNGDGHNDSYLPQGEGIASVIIRVYSLTGNELVFASNELKGWDGTHMGTGQACQDGHYLYAIEAIGTDGQARSQGQVVRLLREIR